MIINAAVQETPGLNAASSYRNAPIHGNISIQVQRKKRASQLAKERRESSQITMMNDEPEISLSYYNTSPTSIGKKER